MVRSLAFRTPNYLGRNPLLLKRLADSTGLHIVTNTGYYGARQNKYLPAHAFPETPEQLAERWVLEFEKGLENSGVRPGFIKIGVDGDSVLSPLHRKLVQAAALTHLRTGLTIVAHTGDGKKSTGGLFDSGAPCAKTKLNLNTRKHKKPARKYPAGFFIFTSQ